MSYSTTADYYDEQRSGMGTIVITITISDLVDNKVIEAVRTQPITISIQPSGIEVSATLPYGSEITVRETAHGRIVP